MKKKFLCPPHLKAYTEVLDEDKVYTSSYFEDSH
jgi:hypothetical protein